MSNCVFCNGTPALVGGMTVYVKLEEQWPRSDKERFKKKLKGENCRAEVHYCTECKTAQVTQGDRIVATEQDYEEI